ncbi:putative ABC transport system ATP-binding protein [Branchiibius hedensis]|uniref:Putative ABC transport system ATP-binding protein n=1 Tax=Branchiibius hedensis TaxID=672460 RepID=A0A2Y8ZYJ0_9MICO|nr:ABC transporter ATP-binding protein [Branchiibius hedensis]PWJ26477.1 putative ABC transport system ATP-binding protein [Branchiibius hedensis]SSA35289.1 putative ABC transport system ATP-binding protein [Branchiibius hedensis]
MPEPQVAVSAVTLVKEYGSGDSTVRALDGVDVQIRQGQYTAIMGPSGSGKSTLLHCLAALDTPTSGEVRFGGDTFARLSDNKLTRLRRERIGFVFQSFNLVPTLTAEENILLPLAMAGRKPDGRWFDQIVESVGLADRLQHRPAQLSGGQQQRVACARALITRPDVIFADEPTGNLDSTASGQVLALLRQAVDEFGQTVVMVTHDAAAAAFTDRILFLSDGRIVDEMSQPTAATVLERMKGLDAGFGQSVVVATDRSERAGV